MEKVFHSMDLGTLYSTAAVSMRSSRIVSCFCHRRHHRFKIVAVFKERLTFEITSSYFEDYVTVGMVDFPMDGFSFFATYLEPVARVFNIQKIDMIFLKQSPEFIIKIFEQCKKSSLAIDKANIISNSPNDDLIENVFDGCRDSALIKVSCETSDRFEFPTWIEPSLTMNVLEISHAKWVTVDHLTEAFKNLKEIKLFDSNLKFNDFHIFFTKWVEGMDIEYADFPYEGFDFADLFENFPGATPADKVQIEDVEDPYVFGEGEGFIIKKYNGTKGLVFNDNGKRIVMRTDFVTMEDEEEPW